MYSQAFEAEEVVGKLDLFWDQVVVIVHRTLGR